MRSCAWLLRSWTSLGRFPPPLSARPASAFPLRHLQFLHGQLVLKLFPRRGSNPGRWRQFTVKAADKVTLNLPEWPALFRKFGSHRGSRGLGPISVELCCVFALLPRMPLAWVVARANTNERTLLKRLLRKLRQADLLLIDNGFYGFWLFALLLKRSCSFIIPVAKNTRPKVIKRLGDCDYLVQIRDSDQGSDATMTLRLIYAYRRGFRRRRILTNLLDPLRYPPGELANLYHLRWDIETFYRDFKETMQARTWHCQTPDTFHKELTMHMIAVVLIRTTMLEAARKRRVPPARLSFSRAFTEARVFLRRVAGAVAHLARWAYSDFVAHCARHLVTVKPGRSFPRNPQEYRAKARGLERKPPGRPKAPVQPYALENSMPETLSDEKGEVYALG